jgi:hypothetical protein
MKKVVIGCAVIAGLMMLVLGIGSYYLYSSAKKYVMGYAELAEIPALNEQIRNRAPYRPPADGRLTSVQVEQYVRIQQSIRNDLGARFREMESKYDQLSRRLDERDRDPGIREILEAWSDMVTLIVDAKKAQVGALNEAGLSLNEYHWIRQQTLMALGYGAFGWNLEALAEDPTRVLEGAAPVAPSDMETLQHNRALLQEYEETIEEWLALSFFGL